MNSSHRPLLELLRIRHEFLRFVRQFFYDRDFLEVLTPTLVVNPGLEPHLQYFETEFVPDMGGGRAEKLYLPTSPEYHLKKALASGAERIFEIAKSFRNGESSREHEPEFLMLEWYRHPGGYEEIAQDLEKLLAKLGERFSTDPLWSRAQHIRVCQAFQEYAQVNLEVLLKEDRADDLGAVARTAGIESVYSDDSFEDAFHKILIEKIEPKLGFQGPCYLWDYPASLCALSRIKKDKPYLCERFEVYWKGIELANAFGELTDPEEQRRRCVLDQSARQNRYGRTPPLDEEFLSSLADLKEAGGIAVGLERLLQCLLEKNEIHDVVPFSHFKRWRQKFESL